MLPNLTAVAPVKPVPVIVTVVPPVVGPELGLIPVTVGGVTGLDTLISSITTPMSAVPSGLTILNSSIFPQAAPERVTVPGEYQE